MTSPTTSTRPDASLAIWSGVGLKGLVRSSSSVPYRRLEAPSRPGHPQIIRGQRLSCIIALVPNLEESREGTEDDGQKAASGKSLGTGWGERLPVGRRWTAWVSKAYRR